MAKQVKTPVDYSNGKIYKIVSDQTDKIYVGSTTKKYVSQRMVKHRNDYKRYLNDKYQYVTSFELIKLGDAKIFLIENYPCDTIDELKARERFHIENNDCTNKNIPGRTAKEYNMNHREKLREKHICECGGQYTTDHKAKHTKTKMHQSYLNATQNS